jgi:hypothetical protein
MSKTKEAPIGTPIVGTTTPPDLNLAGFSGKQVALNFAKRTYFRFADRADFELTVGQPTAKLPVDLTVHQAKVIYALIQQGHLIRGTKPQEVTRKREDKIRPFLIYLSQSRSFDQIRKRIEEVVNQGVNVAGSGYSAREVLEMMTNQELDTHARTDILNLLERAKGNVPGNNIPMDEPGTVAIPRALRASATEVGAAKTATASQGGSRSGREALARKPAEADISKL